MLTDAERRRIAATIHRGNVSLAGYLARIRPHPRVDRKKLRYGIRVLDNNRAEVRLLRGISRSRQSYRRKRRHW